MRCPKCGHWIREEQVYLMSRRIPKDEPLPAHMRLLGKFGLYLIAIVVLAGLFALVPH